MNMHALKNLLAVALLCVLPAAAFADPTGNWAGSVTRGNDQVTVRATFNGKKVNLVFAGGAACQIDARYDKPDGRALTYRFDVAPPNSPPFCDDLADSVLELAYTEGDDTMDISFKSSGKWSGTLGKQG